MRDKKSASNFERRRPEILGWLWLEFYRKDEIVKFVNAAQKWADLPQKWADFLGERTKRLKNEPIFWVNAPIWLGHLGKF